jgi:hypothetical protein
MIYAGRFLSSYCGHEQDVRDRATVLPLRRLLLLLLSGQLPLFNGMRYPQLTRMDVLDSHEDCVAALLCRLDTIW